MSEHLLVDGPVQARVHFNAQGNEVYHWFKVEGSADHYLTRLHQAGWTRWPTDSDAWYFGIWIHVQKRQTFSYVEGDCYQVFCNNAAGLRAELAALGRFHGQAPSYIVLDTETNTRRDIYEKRLSPEDIT